MEVEVWRCSKLEIGFCAESFWVLGVLESKGVCELSEDTVDGGWGLKHHVL